MALVLARRIVWMVPILIGVWVIVSSMTHMAPGDPAEAILGPRGTEQLIRQVRSWMVCSNQVLRPPTPGCANYYGHSRIVAPTGKIVAEVKHEEGIATATVDLLGDIERAGTLDWFGLNLLEDRRPEYYGLQADKGINYQTDVPPLHPRARALQRAEAEILPFGVPELAGS